MMPLDNPAGVFALRQRVWDSGFRPISIYNHDLTRLPAEQRGKAPMGKDWQLRAQQTPPEASVVMAHPDALNTGIWCEGLRAIDIDVDNPTVALAVRRIALDMFGEAPMRYRDNSPRVLLLYRAAQGEPKKLIIAGPFGKVEVLGAGQQFVAFGVHSTGADLKWMPESPSDTTLDSLPAVTEEQVDAFLNRAAAEIGAHRLPKSSTGTQSASQRGQRGDTMQVVVALSSIPNSGSADWEGWNRIGMASWAATGGSEAGRAAFHGWSEQNPAYDPAATNERWDHYRTSPPTKIGAGTLFHMALQAKPNHDDAGPEAEPADLWPTQNHLPAQHASNDLTFPLVFYGEIQPSNDVMDFVQGTLIEGGSAVIYGESNSGKTFCATDLALHVAAGIPWNGKRVEQGAVIYAALEGGQGFQNRVHAWREAHDAHEGPVHFAAIQSSINMLDPHAHIDRLINTIRAAAEKMGAPVKLIVIDTLARAMAGGNENASEDMGALVMNMDRVRQETGAMVMFIHHSGKDAAKGARGHSSLRAAIDTEIEVVAGEGDGPRVATVVKQREMKKGDTHEFTLDVVEIGTNRHGEPVTTCLVKYSDLPSSEASVPTRRRNLPQSQQRAVEVLTDLVARSGQGGHAGTPSKILSVPEDWWREGFYERAAPGADRRAKEKAFRRAADALVQFQVVGMSAGRVWIISYEKGTK